MSLVLCGFDDGVGTLTFNHAEKRNALSEAMIDELLAGLADFRQRGARAVVIRAQSGAGVWSAGHDVAELPPSHRDPLGWDNPLRRLIRAVEKLPVAVIAMVEGSVWGGACELVFACDLIVASREATFAVTPAKLGIPYNLTGLLTFMSVTSLHVLKEMAFTAQPVGAERAERLGIVNRVVAADELERATLELAAQIARNAPLSIAVMKEELNTLSNARDLSPLEFERIQGRRRAVYDSRDYEEGVRAFLEKRHPTFTGE
jgi:methylmalonyl-CoA decarboxylase